MHTSFSQSNIFQQTGSNIFNVLPRAVDTPPHLGSFIYSEVSTFFLDTLVSYISSIRIFHILLNFSYFCSLDTQYHHTYFLAIHRIPYLCTLVFCIFCHISLCHTSIPALYSHISPARILHIFTYPISPTYLISRSAISSTYPH